MSPEDAAGAGPLRVGVLMPAAGEGRRMGGARKPWLLLAGEPVLAHALRPFLARPEVTAVIVALAPPDAADPPAWLRADGRVSTVAGGETRAASVRAALDALDEADPSVHVIVVHDAARPLVTDDVVARCIAVARGGEGAVAAARAVDTLKEVEPDGRVAGTPERARLWHAQTPQAFPAAMLRDAYRSLPPDAPATDDASVVERARGRVVVVESPASNLKVTRPEDLPVAEALLRLAHRDGIR